METKICTKCKTEQDIENFYIRRTRNNQRKTICKECESKQKATPLKIVPDLEGEIWKDAVGLEGIYMVSNKSRVKRIMHRKNPSNNLRKQNIDSGGYVYVTINGTTHSVHRMVAKAFVPNPLNLPQVDHLDNNKKNNLPENLEWVTSKENINRAWKDGLCKSTKGEANIRSVLTEKDVLEIRAIGKSKKAKYIAEIYGVGIEAIYKILRNERWTHI